jgi:hypothetical protein
MAFRRTLTNFSEIPVSFKSFGLTDIQKIYPKEGHWIYNMKNVIVRNNISNLYGPNCNQINNIISNDSAVDNDGHSGSSFAFTKQVVSSIQKNEFNDWSEYCAHIEYKYMLKHFYFVGFSGYAKELMEFNFKNNKKLINKFNSQINSTQISNEERIKLLKTILMTIAHQNESKKK